MRRARLAALVAALAAAAAGRAESLPTFRPGSCSYRATHIVVVKAQDGGEGMFRVVESWKGDLKKDAPLHIPALARDAKGEMVLFLRRDPADAANPWRPAGIFKEWHTSVAWLDGDTVSAVEQFLNPGPAEVRPLDYVKSRKAFRELVAYYVETEQAVDAAKAETDVGKRVAALVAIVTGRYDRKEEAFALLGRCGPKAVPALRKVLDGRPSHDHKYAVAALAAAGGRDAVPEIAKRIEAEVAWWAVAGPKLQRGWWFQTESEAWKRHGTLLALVDVYRTHPTAALEKQVIAVRDLMKNLPAADADRGIPSLSAHCDQLLKGDGD
jgi:hypothetical protein